MNTLRMAGAMIFAGCFGFWLAGVVGATRTKKLRARDVEETREAGEYRAYLAGTSDPRD